MKSFNILIILMFIALCGFYFCENFYLNASTKYLSFDFKNFKRGALTGFTPPINDPANAPIDPNSNNIGNDMYQNLGFRPHDKKQKLNSPTCTTEIFATPNTNNFYRNKNGNKGQDDGGSVGKVGVTIIYD